LKPFQFLPLGPTMYHVQIQCLPISEFSQSAKSEEAPF
jgi:hypothetical protein